MGTPTIELTEAALETLEALEPTDRTRITEKLRSIVEFPEHYLDGLKGIPGYVLRVGRFRVVVDWDRDGEVIYAVAVLERKRDYRELARLGEVWGSWRE